MKTKSIASEILVAFNEEPHDEVTGRVGHQKNDTGSALVLRKWTEGAKLPMPWHFKATNVNTLVAGRTDALITVIDVPKARQSQVYDWAISLANKQVEMPDLGYVFVLHNSDVDVTNQVKLLELFPDPEKVTITKNLSETWGVLRNLVLKWQVRQHKTKPSRKSPLDDMEKVMNATKDLRESNGKLSAKAVATLFDFSIRELALLLDRSRQSINQTPDADSLQDALKYFERIARLRLVLKDDMMFRKWLRMPNPALGDGTPEALLRAKKWQALADFVDDILTGAPG